MDLIIHIYGYIDAMFYALNAVAMLMKSKVMSSVMELIFFVTIAYYGIQTSYAGQSANYKSFMVKIFGMMLVITFSFKYKADMLIADHVTKKKDVVSNIPYIFAVPVGWVEAYGDAALQQVEQSFTLPNSINYRDYGMAFGARMVQDARAWRIKTPEFAKNMHNFMERCVAVDALMPPALGEDKPYDVSTLKNSEDIWTLVSTNAGTIRKVEMSKNGVADLVTCKEAVINYIEPAFKPEIESLIKKKASSDLARASNSTTYTNVKGDANINSFFKQNMGMVFGSYLGVNKPAEDILKQQMMIHAIDNAAESFGMVRASMQQEGSWKITSELATIYLPILLTLVKCITYAAIIFVVPMMLLSGGMSIYKNYLMMVVSLQLWAPLNAVFNMIIDLYSATRLQDIADGIISFATYSEIGMYVDKIVAMAGAAQMSIPVLSFYIVKGGVSGLISLAGNVTSGLQSSAASAASEVVSGNRSFDNISSGNMQMAMQQGFKTDWNQSYASGASQYQHMDGTMERVLANGDTLFQSGSGMTMSGGSTKFNVRESASSQIAENLSNAQSLLMSDQRAYSTAAQSTFDKSSNLVSSLAQRESAGETIDYTKAGEEGQALQQAVNQTRMLHEKYGYGWQQAADTTLKAGVNGNAGLSKSIGGAMGIVGASAGLNLSLGAEGSVSARNTSDQSFGEDKLLNRENQTNVNYNSVVRAASSEQFAKSNNIDTSYAEDLRKSYHQQQSLEGQVAKRAEEVQSYSEALSSIQSKDATYEQDMFHKLEEKVASTYGVSTKDAHNMIESGDARVIPIRKQMVNEEVSKYMAPVMHTARNNTAYKNTKTELDAFSYEHKDKINQDYTSGVKEEAVKRGIDPNDKKFVEDKVSSKANTLISQNEERIEREQVLNETKENQLNQQVEKYEQDRIGQGKFASSFGIGGPTNLSSMHSKNSIDRQNLKEQGSQKAKQILGIKEKD